MADRKFYREIYKKTGKNGRRFFSVIKFIFFAGLTLLVFLALAAGAIFVYYSRDLPRPEDFTEQESIQSTKIYDRTGQTLLYEVYGDQKREIVPLSQVPDILKQAVISTEDANFYSHHGIDIKGIIRSIELDLNLRSAAYGGSTISQQLIRSTFLKREKTLQRKVREAILTLELERRYSKNQILEWYLNQVPFGPNLYGVQTASKTYFNKSVENLSLPEAATLAALIQAPSYYYPYGAHKDDLMKRKDYVLERMKKEGYISGDLAESAKKEEIKFSEISQNIKAPHFVFYVLDSLYEKYGRDFLETGGLKIYTSLDWNLEQKAEQIVKDGAKRNRAINAYNASLVAIDPKTGEILSMVGSADWFTPDSLPKGCTPGKDCLFDPKVNVATYNIGRQPGSSFKPFVYATAFQKGYDDKTVVVDEETNFGIWGGKPYIPHNYTGLFYGPVTLRQALAMSLNVASVKVLDYLAGLDDSLANAKRFGITTLSRPDSFYGLAIVLGGGEVKLLDMVSAYGVFATEGMQVPPVSVLKIEDSQGNIIEENNKTPRRVLDEKSARLISDILSDNTARTPMFGPKSSLYIPDYQVAVKTGTTSDYKDGWTIGYTPSIVVGVWTGNNDNTPIYKEPGSSTTAPIWRAFMDAILPLYPKENFVKPNGETPSPSPTPSISPTP